MEIPKLKTGDTVFEIVGINKLDIIEFKINNLIFTGYSYIIPDKFMGKFEFFECDFGTVLFFDLAEADKHLLTLKEIQKNGKSRNHNKLFSFFSTK